MFKKEFIDIVNLSVKESKKLTNSKVIVYTYRIGQRPIYF